MSSTSRRLRPKGLGLLLLATTACTYGPVEEQARATQIVRFGDSYRAAVLIRRDVFQRPTGLSAFPDGGRVRFLERQAFQTLLDVDVHRAVALASQEATDRLWESFDAHLAGVGGDSVLYLSLTGCPRGGECHPDRMNRALMSLSIQGRTQSVDEVPADAALPGTMLARSPGEEHYVRFRTSQDTIAVRLEEEGPYRPMYRVAPDGSVVPIGG